MNNRIIVTFDKSQEDIPTLVVAEEGWNMFNPSINVINLITGDEAEKIWGRLKQIKEQKNE